MPQALSLLGPPVTAKPVHWLLATFRKIKFKMANESRNLKEFIFRISYEVNRLEIEVAY
jgi:hypothetical protein